MGAEVKQMRWWGWGEESAQFDMSSKPHLWPYICSIVGDEEPPNTPPVPLKAVQCPPQRLNEAFLTEIRRILGELNIRSDKKDRLVHAYGKSFRDLWRMRNGLVEAAPDVVIYPETEEHVAAVVRAAAKHEVVLIPFGGGSNIAGCLETCDANGRMVVSLDMKRMNQVLSVDRKSRIARVQAGVLGPYMEQQLQGQGFTLGHFPDSFEYSTLGGWVATRSAGMQSDKYGKIEDMVLSLRMVTPSGTIVTRTVPKSSNGIDVNHLCIGSEGILGVITEATMRVHPLPARRAFYGFMFPDFESGVAAIYECVQLDLTPMLMRLNDPGKTALSLAYKSRSTPVKEQVRKLFKWYMRSVKHFDLNKVCMMLVGFEGSRKQFNTQRRAVGKIYRKHGAVSLGSDPGKTFERGKYDFPYLRDFIMDRGIMADVSETATVWSNLLPLYYRVMDALDRSIRETGSRPFTGCHISHTYHAGTSLYFTFGCLQKPGRELEQYLYVKKAAEDAFIDGGGTLSHHHAVGTEHLPWVTADISETGVKAVKALKAGLDPKGIMNPGKIIPSADPLAKWGFKEEDVRQAVGSNR